MLKIELDVKSHKGCVQAGGDLFDILADLSYAIGSMYDGFRKRDPMTAQAFRLGIMTITGDGAPTWDLKPDPGAVSIFTVTPKRRGQDAESYD